MSEHIRIPQALRSLQKKKFWKCTMRLFVTYATYPLMNRKPLQKVLAELDKCGLAPLNDFPAKVGRRQVRVVELVGTYAMIQPIDDPRSWEIMQIELIKVDPGDVRTENIL